MQRREGTCRKHPNSLYNDILKAAGKIPARLKLARTVAVTIDVSSEAAATRLLETTSVGGVQIDAHLLAAYRASTASIRRIPTIYTDVAHEVSRRLGGNKDSPPFPPPYGSYRRNLPLLPRERREAGVCGPWVLEVES